jgi:hypothetical protein
LRAFLADGSLSAPSPETIEFNEMAVDPHQDRLSTAELPAPATTTRFPTNPAAVR